MNDAVCDRLIQWIDKHADILRKANDAIWEFAEIAGEERKSSAYLREVLEQWGFRICPGADGLPTSFIAEWGEGGPVLGMLAEYDALAGLSQERSTTRRPLQDGAAGHACGHCTLGAGVLMAAITMKEMMREEKIPGTIRFYGCPAEETVEGKVMMSRDGLFDDCDVALSWHPNDVSYVWARKSYALHGMKFTFHGRSAHAGLDPWNGRSALDGVELMNVGANYLREHLPPTCRLHYTITEGGTAPNIVPDRAQVWYVLRAPERALVEDMKRRLEKIAEGAALMTETTVETQFMAGCYDFLPNRTLADEILKHMRRIGAPKWTENDYKTAKELYEQVPPSNIENTYRDFSLCEEDVTAGLVNGIFDGYFNVCPMGASTDLGDVSWQLPVGCFSYASAVFGAPGHSWFYTAGSGLGIGATGAIAAAKVLALTGRALLTDETLLKKAREEHRANTRGVTYTCPLEKKA